MLESNYSEIPSENSKKKKIIIFSAIIVVVVVIIIFLIVFFMRKADTNISVNETPVVISSQVSSSTSAPEPTKIIDKYPNDKDRDGIDDQKEKELGTSNRDFDTDGDGLSDSDEIDAWKTDPTKSDTDGDTFNDGYEVLNGYNPLGQGKLQ